MRVNFSRVKRWGRFVTVRGTTCAKTQEKERIWSVKRTINYNYIIKRLGQIGMRGKVREKSRARS